MGIDTWWLFVLMTIVVSATPGPNMLLVMTTGAHHGLRAAMASMAGCMSALLAMMSLSAAGLGSLLQAFPALFDALRLGGAAYLAWLGLGLWRAPVLLQQASSGSAAAGASWPALFRQGVLVAASNPKAILFAAAFLPQFIRADLPFLPQFAILLATFAFFETGWYFAYALSGRRLAPLLRRPRFMRGFNRLSGAVFVGFALLMAVPGR